MQIPGTFTLVGKVAAIASATGSAYICFNTPELAGTYLYRLSQQDLDGNIKVIGTRSLTFGENEKWVIQSLGNQWKLVTTDAFTYRLTDMNEKMISIFNRPWHYHF